MTALLETLHVQKRFGSLAALAGVSLSIGEGEIVGLIGPNGAGKTTFVNVVSGSAPGWTGEIRFRSLSLRGLRPHRIARLGIARAFQVAEPFTAMTVVENVMVGALHGGPGRLGVAAARRKALEVLEPLELAGKADAPADALSAPERKRLELAKALAMEPSLLMLDEVMAGLNPAEVQLAVELIRDIHARGVTILMIDHVIHAIESVADRVIVLHHGQKILEGPTADVLRDEQVIAAYLGSRGASARAAALADGG